VTYKNFLDTIYSGLTYLTTTGLTDVIYIKYELEDMMELDPQSYPGSTQSGKSVWITPIPMSIDSETTITYATRIYVAQQIKEDSTDRFDAFSSCVQLVKMLVQWLPDNINGLIYPVSVTPVLLFDATVDGLYFDLSIKFGLECLV
jgi:hypothetical protein